MENGLKRAWSEVSVIHDADVWREGLSQAVTQIQQDTSWEIPHWHVHRLMKDATANAFATNRIPHAAPLELPAYVGFLGGRIITPRKETYLHTPLDPHFKGQRKKMRLERSLY